MTVAQPVLRFFEMCLLGFFLGALYDVFRILRLALPHGRIAVFIEDILYFFAVAVISFSFVLLYADGILRAFWLFGELMGAVLYFFTLSLLIMKAAHLLIAVIRRILDVLYRITLKPLWRVCLWMVEKIRHMGVFLRARYKIVSINRRNRKTKQKNLLKPAVNVVYNKNVSTTDGMAIGKNRRIPGHRLLTGRTRRGSQAETDSSGAAT